MFLRIFGNILENILENIPEYSQKHENFLYEILDHFSFKKSVKIIFYRKKAIMRLFLTGNAFENNFHKLKINFRSIFNKKFLKIENFLTKSRKIVIFPLEDILKNQLLENIWNLPENILMRIFSGRFQIFSSN